MVGCCAWQDAAHWVDGHGGLMGMGGWHTKGTVLPQCRYILLVCNNAVIIL